MFAATVIAIGGVLLAGCGKPEAPRDPSIPPPVDSPAPPMPSGGAASPAPSGGPAPTGMPR